MSTKKRSLPCLKGSYSDTEYYTSLLSMEQIATWVRKGVVRVEAGDGCGEAEQFPAITIIIYGGSPSWRHNTADQTKAAPGYLDLDGSEKTYVCQGGGFINEVMEKYDKGMNGCGLEGRSKNMVPVMFFLKEESEMDPAIREMFALNNIQN